MDELEDALTSARRAYAGQDWPTAAAHFDMAATSRLTADDTAAYADAAWRVGRVEDKLRLGAAACDALEAHERTAEAARIAFELALCHLVRGEEELAGGWLVGPRIW